MFEKKDRISRHARNARNGSYRFPIRNISRGGAEDAEEKITNPRVLRASA